MLSRIAESCYWIGHLVERADYSARLLDVHYHNLLQSHPSESQRLASHLAEVMGVDPNERFNNIEDAMYYIGFNADFPGSIETSISGLAINAKAVQDTIPTELFEVIYATNKALNEKIIDHKTSIHSLYTWVRNRTMMIHGIIDASLVRDDSYHFLNIGRCIERIDMTARMVNIRCAMADDSSAWITMLRSCGAFEGFMRVSGDLSDTNSIIEFLLRNINFPRSILSSASNALSSIQKLTDDPTNNDFSNENDPKFILGRFCAEIEFTSIENVANNLDVELNKLAVAANSISDSISKTYFQASNAINWRQ
ncbi:MAG: alpha-E domain-containing protein [Acidimicrobiia bacterium]|nr:alpha-E domain-containing protein [Acidimicrobiia bacterium]